LTRCIIALVLLFALVINMAIPVLAVDYKPGVTVGQYVKYGNFYGWLRALNETNWIKTEVVAVSGNVVTLRFTGEYRNGTTMTEFPLAPHEITVIDISNGKFGSDDSESGKPAPFVYIMPGNLNGGDEVPPLDSSYFINKTETRNYLGVNRQVNILEKHITDNRKYWWTWQKIYDKTTGLLLELKDTQRASNTVVSYGFSVVETNIFETTVIPPEETASHLEYMHIAIAATIIVTVGVSVLLLKKRSK